LDIPCGNPRRPLRPLEAADVAQLRSILDQAGAFDTGKKRRSLAESAA
jgi:hypothetical protein